MCTRVGDVDVAREDICICCVIQMESARPQNKMDDKANEWQMKMFSHLFIH